MIKLAYCNVENLDLKKGYVMVSNSRKSKIDKYIFDRDKKLSCGVYLLLFRLLKQEGITDPIIKTEKFGKAYISNYENIHFNVSHSKNMICCAISDKPVGTDIEYNDPTIDLDIAKHYFFNSEYETIMNSSNPADEFFNYWVLKESYMKYTGLGFRLDLNSFEIMMNNEITLKNDKKNIKFDLFDTDEYKLGIASHYNVKHAENFHVNEIYQF
ncbi:4'-phosphopantetheinyl transferase superfamily protein [uncultured Methanobrevibacter sp.]|uniref:4'-phosphopantetheinyl transferase family protein n=1 Tax=uncultured Methanobrevibacter sp. TaxID=253161 RepID=UPI0025D1E864|nr:4'-phosphopantetheinyl transferase superfamily protein [uncultured Methanobrevibacter sp.]